MICQLALNCAAAIAPRAAVGRGRTGARRLWRGALRGGAIPAGGALCSLRLFLQPDFCYRRKPRTISYASVCPSQVQKQFGALRDERWRVVDARQSVDAIESEVWAHMFDCCGRGAIHIRFKAHHAHRMASNAHKAECSSPLRARCAGTPRRPSKCGAAGAPIQTLWPAEPRRARNPQQ